MPVKKYYMGVDGGGSKLVSILFDQDLNLISTGGGGSINLNFATLDEVKASMVQSITKCLPEGFKEPIQCCCITMPGPADLYIKLLSDFCPVLEQKSLSEGTICLLAGIQKQKGIVALSGTGSGVFNIIDPEHLTHLGGWGALIGDEGSGFDIGCKGMRAAIHSYDTRGPKTILEEWIQSYFQAEDFLDVRRIIYQYPSFRSVIAKLCLLVLKAANQGDEVAKEIMQEAGSDMAKQVLSIMRRDLISSDRPDIVVSGSVWKGNPIMLDTFRQDVLKEHPTVNIWKPLFEPVVGSAVYIAYRLYHEIDSKISDKLKQQFVQFKYE